MFCLSVSAFKWKPVKRKQETSGRNHWDWTRTNNIVKWETWNWSKKHCFEKASGSTDSAAQTWNKGTENEFDKESWRDWTRM